MPDVRTCAHCEVGETYETGKSETVKRPTRWSRGCGFRWILWLFEILIVSAGSNPISFTILKQRRDRGLDLFSRFRLLDRDHQGIRDRGPYGTQGAKHAEMHPLLDRKGSFNHNICYLIQSVNPS